ncbi:ankyrin [Daldinia decipiens]|uniref:ankyrin n=1 Tax=Daldinia decipiens TaxID=326647 RepID=UPI0020C55BC1|nr:ankyrin [Daldinia decipiens]KAI1660767.1 ankyrin [Daldinia decipiens]
MESEQAMVPRNIPVSEELWREWKDFIYEEFIVNDRGIHEVFESLKQRNPQVTMAQYRTKLRDWAFCKNLTAKNWRYVAHSIQKRRSQNKDTAVVLSGKRIPQTKVKNLTGRHKTVTLRDKWRPPPSPELPNTDIPLYICTPRAASPVETPGYEWPNSLPWFQLCESILPKLMSGLKLLPENETGAASFETSSQERRLRERRQSNGHMAWAAFEILVRQSMKIVIGSDTLVETLLLRKSVDRISGYLDDVIPPHSLDENLRRAVILTGGTRSEVLEEVLKILLFLSSNFIIMDRYKNYGLQYFEQARAFIDVFRMSGLAEAQTLAKLVEASLNNPTVTAVIDVLYDAAVATEAADIVFKLLAADGRIHIDHPVLWSQRIDYATPSSALQSACVNGSLEFASHMIRAGASITAYDELGYSPLMLAALATPNSRAIQLVQLLLQQGAILNDEQLSKSLCIAIMKGNFQLIDLLHELGVNFTLMCPVTEPPFTQWEFTAELDYVTCIGLAAHYKTEDITKMNWFTNVTGRILDYEEVGEGADEDISLRLVKHILDRAGPKFDIDGKHKSDAIILASQRGYNSVISFLYHSGARLDSENGCLDPIRAAVIWANVETCRLLLELGASAQPDSHRLKWRRINYNLWGHAGVRPARLSLLHIAVYYDSQEIVDLLIRAGADINYICRIYMYDQDPEIGEGYKFQIGPMDEEEEGEEEEDYDDDESERAYEGEMIYTSPLHLAIRIGAWKFALFLANLGATPTCGDLFRSAEAGQYQLVNQLIELGADMSEGANALHISICNEHEPVALQLLKSGVVVGHDTLISAFTYGHHKLAIELIETGVQLYESELSWAFRIPNELKVRSILQSREPYHYLNNRSPDGRSFLENAILSGDLEVMRFALSLDAAAYDSGALCAAVITIVRSSLIGMNEILDEVLSRREVAKNGQSFDPILENTAISIAAYYKRIDIAIRIRGVDAWNTNVAVLPKKTVWVHEKDPTDEEDFIDEEDFVNYHDFDISIVTMSEYYISTSSSSQWYNWHDPDKWLVSPLFLAIKSNSESTVEELLELGYEPDGHTLKAAIEKGLSDSLITRLAECCTDINALGALGMARPESPVHVAARSGNINLVKFLLSNGADPNVGRWDVNEKTLGELILRRDHDMLHLLLQHGLNVKITPQLIRRSITALQIAVMKGYIGIVRHLLACGADPNVRRERIVSVYGPTAIVTAAKFGRIDIVRLLLDSGVVTDGPGRLPYIEAVITSKIKGDVAILQLLVLYRRWTAIDFLLLATCIFADYSGSWSASDRYTEVVKGLELMLSSLPDLETDGLEAIEATIRQEKIRGFSRHIPIYSNDLVRLFRTIVNYITPITEETDVWSGIVRYLRITTPGRSLPRIQIDPLEEVTIFDVETLEETEAARDISDPDICLDLAEEESTGIQLGPRCGNEEEERNRRILDDLLGEREAPFESVEWQW